MHTLYIVHIWRKRSYPHPHIRDDNTPCLGNVSAMLLTHMANNDVALIVCLVTDFLQTYNLQSPYIRLCEWTDNKWENYTCYLCKDVLSRCECSTCTGCGTLQDRETLSTGCGFCSSCCINHHKDMGCEGIHGPAGPTTHITKLEFEIFRNTQRNLVIT